MGINPKHFRLYVVRPTLHNIDLWSVAAEELLMFTAAHESHMGEFLQQENGPAIGVFQVEPATHNWIWQDFLLRTSATGVLRDKLKWVSPAWPFPRPVELYWNLALGVVDARLKYLS